MRKVVTVVITEPGRDVGKVFVITEAPASRAEKWAARALLLAAQSGADVGNAGGGIAALAAMSIQTIMGLKFADVEPLLDEMFTCVQIQPNPQQPSVVRPLIEDDIEEVATRTKLRAEVLNTHLGFSFAEALSTLRSGATAPAA